ncbi:MAG: phage portal protein [Candidatus Aminicenantes bacterium]|nr:phage portal protein [Candidatus Aminicenantes bacterium]
MSIFNKSKILQAEVRELRDKTAELGKQVVKYKETQELLVKDILTLQEVSRAYVGNDYQTYDEAVLEISEKYCGRAKWGVLQTRSIIDLRAAFILGEGLKVTHATETRAEAERELQFAEDFMSFNDLDGELDQEMAKEAEIEGKIAIRLWLDEEPFRDWDGMVSARFLSWLTRKYEVKADTNDYLWYKNLSWKATGTAPAGSLEEPDFVYAKFGGRINAPNEAQPKIAACLTQIDRLDRALRDLREIDHLFASPTPYFKVVSVAEGTAIETYIEKTNWKIGKALVTSSEFSIVSAPITGVDNLIAEIELCVKMISGATGIPIHYLGLLDLLKNRSTGENIRELIMASTTRERQTWIGVYEELLTKAMQMWNATYAAQYSKEKQLDPTRIKVDIPQVTQEHWDHIEKVLIPAVMANIISKEHVAGQIPGVDQEKEAELRADQEAKDAKQAKEEMAALKEEMDMKDARDAQAVKA